MNTCGRIATNCIHHTWLASPSAQADPILARLAGGLDALQRLRADLALALQALLRDQALHLHWVHGGP